MIAIHPTAARYHPLSREARFASRLTRALDDSSQSLPPGVEERLRVAREQAVAKARPEPRSVFVAVSAGVAMAGWSAGGWWTRAALLLPIAALVAGLIAIDQQHRDSQIDAAVEIDSALLVDDAPLAAYRDAGFLEFLKSPAN